MKYLQSADWKLAVISPLFKRDPTSKSDPGNYPPVSLTSVVCKVMESIIRDTVVVALKDKFSCFQHGFMKHRSCLTNLLEYLDGQKHMMMVTALTSSISTIGKL